MLSTGALVRQSSPTVVGLESTVEDSVHGFGLCDHTLESRKIQTPIPGALRAAAVAAPTCPYPIHHQNPKRQSTDVVLLVRRDFGLLLLRYAYLVIRVFESRIGPARPRFDR